MNLSESTPTLESNEVPSVILVAGAPAPALSRQAPISEPAATSASPKHSGYGLPCLKCRTYYAADLKTCPVCKTAERVSPVTTSISAASKPNEGFPDPNALEEERERFLREFKTQVFASQLQINATTSVRCVKEEVHHGGFEAAAVCQGCYDHLQERVDVLEAAMHMDVKEAAQVVYDAVWADPSDPTKTYQNAAQALLAELRKRSGITPVFGPLAPLPD